MGAPDFAEPIVGWRAWRVAETPDGLRLLSAIYDEVWEPRSEVVASCLRGSPAFPLGGPPDEPHRAPEASCSCGVHAVRELEVTAAYLIGRDDAGVLHRVLGEVALWGRVVEAEAGWRAERAYPARLWVPTSGPGGKPAPALEVALALEAYGVPVDVLQARPIPKRTVALRPPTRKLSGTQAERDRR